MPIIGSGPGIAARLSRETGAVRADGTTDSDAAPSAVQTGTAASRSGVAASTAGLVTSAALDAGAVPVDQDRVAAIRKAIETGSYPVVPTKIGDAMIAAGMLLRMPKQ